MKKKKECNKLSPESTPSREALTEIFQARCGLDELLHLLVDLQFDVGVEVAASQFLLHAVDDGDRAFVAHFLLHPARGTGVRRALLEDVVFVGLEFAIWSLGVSRRFPGELLWMVGVCIVTQS